MGLFFSTLHIFKSFSQLFLIHDVGEVVIQNNITPLCFLRQDDYTSYGVLRPGVEDRWNMTLKSMIFLDLNTRTLVWPEIQKRMDRMEASLKYTNCNLAELKGEFPKWNEKRIFEVHDLFQAFEVDGDGLITIPEMSVGLDNLGDKSSKAERIPQLCIGDEDGTGTIDFEEFLQILYEQQQENSQTSLAKTFKRVNTDIKFVRWMSTYQQIAAGLL